MKIIKVLVDEMPSGCKRCNFCVAKMYCSLLEDRKTTVPDEPYKRRADCPLVYDFGDRETNALNKRIAELEAAQRWTPVEHGLPSGYPCLVVLKNGNIKIDFTFLDGGNYYWWNSGQANVTHWMPLPTPPEATHDR